jgi:hypothetical protein
MSNYKKIKSTIMVPEDTYKETRILAIRKGMDIGSLVDEALREKIVRDYQQMGLQPPFPQIQPQTQPQTQPQSQPQSLQYQSRPQSLQKNDQSIFGKPIMAPLRNGQVEINLTIPELTFPTNKEKIRQILLKNIEWINQELTLNKEITPESQEIAEKLLDIFKMNLDIVSNLLMFKKVYKDVGQIEEEIIKAPKKRLADLHIKHRPEGTIGGCKIRWGPDIIKDRMGMKLIT